MASDQCIFSQLHVYSYAYVVAGWPFGILLWNMAVRELVTHRHCFVLYISQPVLILVIEDVLSLGDDDCHCSIAENDTAIEHLCNCHAFLLMLILSLQLSSTNIRQSFSRGEQLHHLRDF